MLAGDLCQQRRRNQQIRRRAALQLVPQRCVQRGGGQQRDVEQVDVDGVEVFARFVQRVEALLQVVARLLGVAGDGRVRRGDGLVLKVRLVDADRIAHLAGEQLDLQPAETQREKIGRQLRIDCRGGPLDPGERTLQRHLSIGFGDEHRPFVFGPGRIAGGQPVQAERGDANQPARQVLGRDVDPLPIGQRTRGGHSAPGATEHTRHTAVRRPRCPRDIAENPQDCDTAAGPLIR